MIRIMGNGDQGERVHILLVEDNPGDAELAVEAFNSGKVSNKMDIVQDGVEAMSYLRREGEFADMPRPDLILLDLNMPKKDGREVLAEIKADESLRRIPVIILTTSESESDVLATYNMNSNCYIVKPVDFDQFCKAAQLIEDFWFSLVKLPAH